MIYHKEEENISTEQILSQIKVLNDDFRRENSDTVNTPEAFRHLAGSLNIQFKLASVDPHGNPTNGITRTYTEKEQFSGYSGGYYSDSMKYTSKGGRDAWDNKKYLNIWVCNISKFLGYGTYPEQNGNHSPRDGVVVKYYYFGTTGNVMRAPFNKGRTLTHEVGHWLGLPHIFGFSSGCYSDDFIDDTPKQYDQTVSCSTFPKVDQCTPQAPGIMFMNYMDYTDDGCKNMFTKGQVERMLSVLDPIDGMRKEILVDAVRLTETQPNLIVRDHHIDDGIEPLAISFRYWDSPDIWLADHAFKLIHTKDIKKYKSCYIAVRIRNISHLPSKGTEKLHLHWSRSLLRSVWNTSWNEKVTSPQGISIPVIQPNEDVVMYVLWDIPPRTFIIDDIIIKNNQSQPSAINPPPIYQEIDWGFALLARIDDGNPIKDIEATNILTTTFALNSNNISIDNGTTLVLFGTGFRQMSDLGYINKPFSVDFTQITNADQYKVGDFAELYALLTPDLMSKLNLSQSRGIKVVDEMSVQLLTPDAELKFDAMDNRDGVYYIGAKVHFISDKIPEQKQFDFDLTLRESDKGEEALRFTAVRDESVFFKANAEVDKPRIVKTKENILLSTNIISDNADYVWFDDKGAKVGEGSQINITPDRSQKYKVAITKQEDGYRAYDEVEIMAVDGIIKSLSPNPARTDVMIQYSLSDNVTSGSIHVSNLQNTISVAYPLDTNATEKNISLSGFVSGSYIVQLVVDGVVVDSKQLIIY